MCCVDLSIFIIMTNNRATRRCIDEFVEVARTCPPAQLWFHGHVASWMWMEEWLQFHHRNMNRLPMYKRLVYCIK